MWSFTRCQDVGRGGDRAEIQRHAERFESTGNFQIVLKVHVAQVVGIEPPRQVAAIGIPVQQVEGTGRSALEIVVDDEMPYQVVGAQHGERVREFAPRHQARLLKFLFGALDKIGIDVNADVAGLGKNPAWSPAA